MPTSAIDFVDFSFPELRPADGLFPWHFPEVFAEDVPGQAVLVRIACVETLIDEVNHIGWLLPWVAKP